MIEIAAKYLLAWVLGWFLGFAFGVPTEMGRKNTVIGVIIISVFLAALFWGAGVWP